jgi:hypothetical protein
MEMHFYVLNVGIMHNVRVEDASRYWEAQRLHSVLIALSNSLTGIVRGVKVRINMLWAVE